MGCESLISITLPNSLTTIGWSSFQDCLALSSITIPNNVTLIETSAFYGCSGLKSITIGEKVKTIKPHAFALCKNLTDVYCIAENVPNTASSAFDDSYIEYATLHVPTYSVELYKAEEPWKRFNSIVSINTDVDNIHASSIVIKNIGNTISISGVKKGTPITIYDTSGKIVATAITISDCTSIVTSLRYGETAIIKIGEMSVKKVLK